MQEKPVFTKLKPRKLLPLALIAILLYAAIKTNIINEALQNHLLTALRDQVGDLVTVSANCLVGLVFVALMYLIYDPVRHLVEDTMKDWGLKSEAVELTVKIGNLAYWIITIFVGVSFIAPNFLSKLFIGFTFIGAALVLALNNFANNFVAGMMLTFSPKFQTGDKIDIIGIDADGEVLSVGYLSTKIRSEDGAEISIANRDLWEKPVKIITNVQPVEKKDKPLKVQLVRGSQDE